MLHWIASRGRLSVAVLSRPHRLPPLLPAPFLSLLPPLVPLVSPALSPLVHVSFGQSQHFNTILKIALRRSHLQLPALAMQLL
jgi:hypothetical protein